MSTPFAPANRHHHLLLVEAHQVNEFLDARLAGAEVPEDRQLAVARDVLELALAARRDEHACGDADWARLLIMNEAPAPFFRKSEAEAPTEMEARLSGLAKQHPRAAEALLRIFAANPVGGVSVYLPLWGTSDGSGASAQARQSCS